MPSAYRSQEPRRAFPVNILINGLIGEVKGRRDGFRTLYGWLEDRETLFIRADKKSWFVVQPLEGCMDIYHAMATRRVWTSLVIKALKCLNDRA